MPLQCGQTALHMASNSGQVGDIEALIANSADAKATNKVSTPNPLILSPYITFSSIEDLTLVSSSSSSSVNNPNPLIASPYITITFSYKED